jgi:hypothetical protein
MPRQPDCCTRPQVAVASPDMVEAAMSLHKEAHAKCFIANSVNFPVRHQPVITIKDGLGCAQGLLDH